MTPQSGHLELVKSDGEALRGAAAVDMETGPDKLSLSAAELARNLAWIPGQQESRNFRDRCETLTRAFRPVLASVQNPSTRPSSDDFRALQEQIYLLSGELGETCATFSEPHKLPQVRTAHGTIIPRVAALAEDYLAAVGYQFSQESFASYIQAFQQVTVLKMAEIWMLVPVMKLVLMEHIAELGRRLLEDPSGSYAVRDAIRGLQDIKQTPWKDVTEPLILFDRVLRDDPAGAYSRMDYETREQYRQQVVKIADRSDCSEMRVASEVLALAREAQAHPHSDPRVTLRDSHVGSYLVAEGMGVLRQRTGFHPPFTQRLRTFLLQHPDELYLPGIAALTFAIVSGVVLLLTPPTTSLWLVLLAILAVLLPGSQSAVQIMNYLATLLLPAQTLPKLDFSEGIPNDCVTLVAIPTVLMNEKQVRRLVDDLEVRYLGNQDANIHYALLSDLPDSPFEPREDNILVDLAADLVRRLNEKYAGEGMGSFFLFHRHRVYNPRERLWMGWERKRGKLMDLNNLLRDKFDSFPVKVGNLSTLPNIRFVITLDSDTELPRGSAARMAGTLAHPLNQAIIDPDKGIVVAGYGILQPRVGVSVQSSARSRLASIYSGQTGFDIYTHATSDVYQDLYGEGIFVGKGIYEVDTLQRVLARRFPRNALLSHDLVEGAYARAGLVSDIEVIEDYPSHYSAHNRRKHRWMRGDWQIAGWLLPLVPEESGRRVPNPLSVVSRWKILDNLRRSLVEPATFALFLLGWLCLPGKAGAWTAATVIILFLPALCQFAFEFMKATTLGKNATVRDAFNSFLNASIANILTITFLAHQALLSLDAVVRTMVRRLITRQRLLQWETAAEAELAGDKRTTLDIYLNWTPLLAVGVFLLVWLVRRGALAAALPILLLWAISKPMSVWLNRPPRAPRKETSDRDYWLLHEAALRTWRYFDEFSTEEHHWLIPDNVREENTKVAARISTTNLGLLLNSRQVACGFGYLTVPEFAQQTLRTLETVLKLPRHRGHLLNWYDTRTLAPLTPAVVSSVDNGNLIASLWTLQQGSLDLLKRRLFPRDLAQGLLDHFYVLSGLGALPRKKFLMMETALKQRDGLQYLLDIPDADIKDLQHPDATAKESSKQSDVVWWQEKAKERIRQACRAAQVYAPWMLPEYAAVKNDPAVFPHGNKTPALEQMPLFIDRLALQLGAAIHSKGAGAPNKVYSELLDLLPEVRSRTVRLIEDLQTIADQAGALADEMDFSFMLNPGRKLLSVAYEVEKERNHPACYDLLASEARIAYFVAIAKDDIPQESWFQLGRPPMVDEGVPGLLSWTGTMFEYLMPALWMRLYPNTLLERSAEVAVRAQRVYAARRKVPWGISESASATMDAEGNYFYFAFGVPQLAIHKPEQEGPVISPYSTFLALDVEPAAAMRNLRGMQRKQCLGSYGFYESLDYSKSRRRSHSRGLEIVRCWMAHHQGMSLLAMANFLHDEVVQDWFHSHPRVQATELLLQEKPAARVSAPKARAEVA
ncbi:MAG: glucoamylase family protein [Candidatus Sulfotelmatobacter sp.]